MQSAPTEQMVVEPRSRLRLEDDGVSLTEGDCPGLRRENTTTIRLPQLGLTATVLAAACLALGCGKGVRDVLSQGSAALTNGPSISSDFPLSPAGALQIRPDVQPLMIAPSPAGDLVLVNIGNGTPYTFAAIRIGASGNVLGWTPLLTSDATAANSYGLAVPG
jgi:hypothetical protein